MSTERTGNSGVGSSKWFSCPFCGEAGITSEYDSYGTTLYCADGCHGRFNFPAFAAEVMAMWKRNRRKLRQENEKSSNPASNAQTDLNYDDSRKSKRNYEA